VEEDFCLQGITACMQGHQVCSTLLFLLV